MDFKRIDTNSYKSIQKLYFECFGIRKSIQQIKDKYNTIYFGLKNIGFVSEFNGIPSAYYGVFPIVLSYNYKSHLIAQSGDIMTAPDHRKKGLFVGLARLTHELAKENGVELVYGFPNKNSHHGLKKLNWTFNGKMKTFKIKGNIPLCESGLFRKLYKKYVNYILSKYLMQATPRNINCFQHTTAGYIKKNHEFFNYKLANFDNYLIKINDFSLFIKIDDHLIIGDIGLFNANRLSEFIDTIKFLVKKLMCRRAIISVSQNHWLFSLLRYKLPYSEGPDIGFYEINKEIDVKQISFTYADFDTF